MTGSSQASMTNKVREISDQFKLGQEDVTGAVTGHGNSYHPKEFARSTRAMTLQY